MQILAFLLDSVASFFCTLFLLRFLTRMFHKPSDPAEL